MRSSLAALLALASLGPGIAACSSDDTSSDPGGSGDDGTGGVAPSAVPVASGSNPTSHPPSSGGPQLGPPQPPGGVLLDAHGNLYPFGGVKLDTTGAPSWPNDDVARSLVVRIDGSGGWVLDAAGAIHAFGKAPALQGPDVQQGKDVARALVVLPDEKSGYVLEADGKVIAFGEAPALSGGPSWNWDIARGLDVHLDANKHADGAWVMDGWGGIHKMGAAPDLAGPPYYSGVDLWYKLHIVEGGAWAVSRQGILEPCGSPKGVPLTGFPDLKSADVVRDVVPMTATGAFDGSRALNCPTAGTYCANDGIPGSADVLYECSGAGGAPAKATFCDKGCAVMPQGVPDYCHGVLQCGNLQWWNTALTYGPYQNYGWWDTDLAVSASTPVQLRHDSKLTKTGVYGWGYMPEFVDQVTGKNFRFLHLRPQDQYATNVGQVYPAGTIVGLSGGDTGDTGYPTYSTGAHLCVQTLDDYRTCFPTGQDPCQ